MEIVWLLDRGRPGSLCGGAHICDFQERKYVSCPSIAISFYLPGHISSLLVLLDTSSLSMSMFQNTEYMDARGATFNNVGRDQINVVMGPNSLGVMQNHSCTITAYYVKYSGWDTVITT